LKHEPSFARSFARLLALAASLWIGAAVAADRDNWLVLQSVGPGKPEILNVARDLPDAAGRAKFPVLVEVLWQYKSLANGMPAESEAALGKRLYDGLDAVFGAQGVHVMTRTGDGGRTMYYYVANPERHAAQIKAFFDGLPPFSVQVRARDEPEWETVREVREAVK
jgi:hypothetical protein